jgi:ABC-type Fe3+ transport system substrate-binding protein
LLTDVQFLETATKNGWIVDPKPLNLPAIANFPATGIINGNAFTQTIASYDIAYNTNQVKGADVPTKWEDVLNSKWKGQLYIPDPRGNTSSLAFFYLMLKTYGESFLTGLQAQALRVVASGTTALNNIAAGDGAMLVANNKFSNAPLVAAGAPIGNTVDIEPTTYLEEYMFILNGGPSPNSAAVFLNFAISEAGQFAQCNNLCSSVLKIPSVIPTPNYTPMTPLFNEATANAAKVTSLLGL